MESGLVLSTDMVDSNLRLEFWREMSRPLFDLTLAERDNKQLDGFLHAYRLGELTLAAFRFSEQLINIRDRRDVLNSGLDHYLVQVMTGGTMTAAFDDLTALIHPGDIWLFDLARLYHCNAAPGSRVTLAIPREPIDRANGGRSAHGLVLPAANPMTGLLRRYLIDLHATAGGLGPEDLRAMEAVTMDLIASAISRRREDQGRQSSSTDRIRQRMLRFIDDHIGDPKLGPELLMRHFQMSRAHLYRFFAASGGVAAVIRNRRLDAAYRILRNPSSSRRSITDIAFELGFSNSAHLARAFTGRFALPPSRVRSDEWLPDQGLGMARIPSHFETHRRDWLEGR